MHWPLWVKVYAVAIGAPMIAVSLALTLWIILIGLGDALASANIVGRWLISGVYVVAFGTTAWLFFSAIYHIVFDKPEALLYAATGHLLLAMPATMFAVVNYLRQPLTFIGHLTTALDELTLNQPSRLIVWIMFHTYIALGLALADRTAAEG